MTQHPRSCPIIRCRTRKDWCLKPLDLVDTAELLAKAHKGRPSQASLRRAISTAYYAMFHCVCRSCADYMVGGPGADRDLAAWKRAYRQPDHNTAAKAHKNQLCSNLSEDVKAFGSLLAEMQVKRHEADYGHGDAYRKSAVLNDIGQVRVAIQLYEAASARDKRTFVSVAAFKGRQG